MAVGSWSVLTCLPPGPLEIATHHDVIPQNVDPAYIDAARFALKCVARPLRCLLSRCFKRHTLFGGTPRAPSDQPLARERRRRRQRSGDGTARGDGEGLRA